MSQPLVRKRSSSIRSLDLQSSQGTPNDLPREAKSAPYKDARYETHLATRGAFMTKPPVKVDDKSVKTFAEDYWILNSPLRKTPFFMTTGSK